MGSLHDTLFGIPRSEVNAVRDYEKLLLDLGAGFVDGLGKETKLAGNALAKDIRQETDRWAKEEERKPLLKPLASATKSVGKDVAGIIGNATNWVDHATGWLDNA